MGADFGNAEAFAKADLGALKKDIEGVLTTSQDWWLADYGTHGRLMFRLAWHSARTYRSTDGRGGASQKMTDVHSFAWLAPTQDGFRNHVSDEDGYDVPTPKELVNRAELLGLTAPEMTVLVGGMRVLDANFAQSRHGVLTDKPGQLSNDFFVNLLDMRTAWKRKGDHYVGNDRETGAQRWTATDVDLVFGSNSQLRGICEVYAGDDAEQKFVDDFVDAWVKVMRLDRFDLDRR